MRSPFSFCLDLWHCSFNVKNVSGCKFGSLFFDCLFPIFKRHLKMLHVNGLLEYGRFSASLEKASLHLQFLFFEHMGHVNWFQMWITLLYQKKFHLSWCIHLNNFGLILCYFLKVFNLCYKELQVYCQYTIFFPVFY